jgi:hypothetical protein
MEKGKKEKCEEGSSKGRKQPQVNKGERRGKRYEKESWRKEKGGTDMKEEKDEGKIESK